MALSWLKEHHSRAPDGTEQPHPVDPSSPQSARFCFFRFGQPASRIRASCACHAHPPLRIKAQNLKPALSANLVKMHKNAQRHTPEGGAQYGPQPTETRRLTNDARLFFRAPCAACLSGSATAPEHGHNPPSLSRIRRLQGRVCCRHAVPYRAGQLADIPDATLSYQPARVGVAHVAIS